MADDRELAPDLVSSLQSRFTVIRPELLNRMASLEDLDSEAMLADRMAAVVVKWNSYDPPLPRAIPTACRAWRARTTR
jgi:hypothetical protein